MEPTTDDHLPYEIHLSQGDLSICLGSDDAEFISRQMARWYGDLMDERLMPIHLRPGFKIPAARPSFLPPPPPTPVEITQLPNSGPIVPLVASEPIIHPSAADELSTLNNAELLEQLRQMQQQLETLTLQSQQSKLAASPATPHMPASVNDPAIDDFAAPAHRDVQAHFDTLEPEKTEPATVVPLFEQPVENSPESVETLQQNLLDIPVQSQQAQPSITDEVTSQSLVENSAAFSQPTPSPAAPTLPAQQQPDMQMMPGIPASAPGDDLDLLLDSLMTDLNAQDAVQTAVSRIQPQNPGQPIVVVPPVQAPTPQAQPAPTPEPVPLVAPAPIPEPLYAPEPLAQVFQAPPAAAPPMPEFSFEFSQAQRDMAIRPTYTPEPTPLATHVVVSPGELMEDAFEREFEDAFTNERPIQPPPVVRQPPPAPTPAAPAPPDFGSVFADAMANDAAFDMFDTPPQTTAAPTPVAAPVALPDAVLQAESVLELCDMAPAAATGDDFLMLSAFYLSAIRQVDKYTLKDLNAQLLRSGLTPVNHATLESVIAKGWMLMVPDLTGTANAAEYTLSPAGLTYTQSLLSS